MHTIDNEQNTTKNNQLLATVGFKLDIEKDSLVSEMKEKVAELEKINKKYWTLFAIWVQAQE